jgi:hypothetical protein
MTGLNCGTTYFFTVSSVGADGKKVPAAPVSAMPCVPPGAPQGLKPTISPNQIALAWSAPASGGGGAVSYAVSVNGGAPTTVTGTSDTLTGLADFQTYSVTVTATSPAGAGAAVTTSVNLSAGPWGGYHTYNNSSDVLYVRSGPGKTYGIVYTIPIGGVIGVTVYCQSFGGPYTDPSGSPSGNLWDKVSSSSFSGWIADGYVNTPHSMNNSYSFWPC